MSRLAAPSPGTFLRPLGGYCYTYEVQAVFPSARPRGGLPHLLCRRWGLKNGLPYNDGHICDNHGLYLRARGPSVWSSPAWYPDDVRRGAMLWQIVPGPHGQMGLFS